MPALKEKRPTESTSFHFSRLEEAFVLLEPGVFRERIQDQTRRIRDAVRAVLRAYSIATFDAEKTIQDQIRGFSPTNADTSFKCHRATMESLGFYLPLAPGRFFDAYLKKTIHSPIQVLYRDQEPSPEDALIALAFRERLEKLLKILEKIDGLPKSARKKVKNPTPPPAPEPAPEPEPVLELEIIEEPVLEPEEEDPELSDSEILDRIKAFKAGRLLD